MGMATLTFECIVNSINAIGTVLLGISAVRQIIRDLSMNLHAAAWGNFQAGCTPPRMGRITRSARKRFQKTGSVV
ncbi:MAG: hypothetical protein LBB48_04180 [Treponema sp.]|nr:hypothetical protein [Treponema sp.]